MSLNIPYEVTPLSSILALGTRTRKYRSDTSWTGGMWGNFLGTWLSLTIKVGQLLLWVDITLRPHRYRVNYSGL